MRLGGRPPERPANFVLTYLAGLSSDGASCDGTRMTSPYGLQGRVAVVTGGSRGIGRAVAGALAAAGAQVCVTARDTRAVRRTADELGGAGLAGDVADPAHLQELNAFALRTFGRIDVLVNNAATNQPYGPLVEAEPGRWREAFTVNVEAPLRLVQCVWRAWMGEHGGTVVNICTEGAGHVGPNVGAYGTSRAALLHLTRQLAGELAPKVRSTPSRPGSSARRRPDSSGRAARTPSPRGCRWAASARPRTSRAPCSGRRRTRRAGSPARTCWSTAEPGSDPRTSRSPPPPGRTPSSIDCAHVRRIRSDVTGVTSFGTTDSKGGRSLTGTVRSRRGPGG